ncbi:DUF805 domain-containing protein [Tardiphaga sp. 619_E2_N8_5]|jgi:uncharacterized membrane protein YhaH (DUF805 family)|uniref:DUF805 domain-containing protein n=1 Tax=unclassified Tardiphaga TaxID=2631404 RepID=UPI003F255E42
MDWTTLLFSFTGRINRGKYWLAILIYLVIWIAFIAAAVMWLGGFDTDRLFSMVGAAILLWLAAIVLIVAGTWSGIATGIKRLHDREKSGWWILAFWLGPSVLSGIGSTSSASTSFVFHIASFAVTIWAIVELGFLRGTAGPNEYGPDPLAALATAPRV